MPHRRWRPDRCLLWAGQGQMGKHRELLGRFFCHFRIHCHQYNGSCPSACRKNAGEMACQACQSFGRKRSQLGRQEEGLQTMVREIRYVHATVHYGLSRGPRGNRIHRRRLVLFAGFSSSSPSFHWFDCWSMCWLHHLQVSFRTHFCIPDTDLFRGGASTKLQFFLIVSTCLLYLVAAGLLSRAVWLFESQAWTVLTGNDAAETGSGPGSYDIDQSVWHLNVSLVHGTPSREAT